MKGPAWRTKTQCSQKEKKKKVSNSMFFKIGKMWRDFAPILSGNIIGR